MKVKLAIIDTRAPSDVQRRLELLGFRVITLPPYSKLSPAVASHTDMLIHRIGNEYISYADYCEEASYVFTDISLAVSKTGAKLSFTADEVSSEYPRDCRLNALRMGDKLFCRVDSASEYLLDAARSAGLEIVNTKQGYPACTVLKLTENDAITADRGMAKLLGHHGIRVTLIDDGDISLPPHEYGFIGGAAEAYDGALYFLGDPKFHKNADAILSAAKNAGLKVISLSDTPLTDLGGILFAEGCID